MTTRHLCGERVRARGFTTVEVMIAMTLLAIGAAGVIGMQRATIQGGEDARRFDMATNIANEWLSRLQRDASFWSEPNSQVPDKMNLGTTRWLKEVDNCAGIFCSITMPSAPADGLSPAFDQFGRDLPSGITTEAFCVQYRLQWVAAPGIGPGYAPPLKLTGLLRAEVRVYWKRQQFAPVGNCGSPPDEVDPGGLGLPHGVRDDDGSRGGAPMSGPMRASTSRARSLARRRAFTLVELMVSLVAGLLVTIAVVGLAKTATTTFYEQARLSTVEASVRSASERLRQDLSRVAFMSTGNIQLARNDSAAVPFGQKISHVPGAAVTSRYTATDNLQGIRIIVAGSLLTGAQGPKLLSDVNGLRPDRIELTGNFTTDDSYRGRMVGNGGVIATAVDDPAVARLLAGADPDRALRNAFTPGAPTGAVPPFVARVVDPRGCSHFVVLSALAGTAASATFTFAAPNDGTSPVLTPSQDQSTCGATDQEEVTINPVQTVHWYIGTTNPALEADPAVAPAGDKFDLYREIRDATGAAVPSPGGPQVVAEYAIDLKFGITVNDPAAGLVPPANHKTFEMDANTADIATWTAPVSGTTAGQPAAQRIRSVRFRLATRASIPDRSDPLSLLPGEPYLSRYCTEAAAPCKRFARVRTIMSEVALINQAGMTY